MPRKDADRVVNNESIPHIDSSGFSSKNRINNAVSERNALEQISNESSLDQSDNFRRPAPDSRPTMLAQERREQAELLKKVAELEEKNKTNRLRMKEM